MQSITTKQHNIKNCIICGKSFDTFDRGNSVFKTCSQECSDKLKYKRDKENNQKSRNAKREIWRARDKEYTKRYKLNPEWKKKRAEINKRFVLKHPKLPTIRKCIVCGKDIVNVKHKRICSENCLRQREKEARQKHYRIYYKGKTKRCVVCNKEFNSKERHCSKVCSINCALIYKRKNRKIIKQQRKARKRMLPHTFNNKQWRCCLNYFNNKCCYCGKENSTLHQDHLIPISKGGGYIKENIVPACAECNSSKGDKEFNTWYTNKDCYSLDKHLKILIYINKDNIKGICIGKSL